MQSSGSYPVNNVGVVVDDVAYRILSLFRRRARQTRHVPAVHTTAAAARFQPYLRQLAAGVGLASLIYRTQQNKNNAIVDIRLRPRSRAAPGGSV